jgi:hypothetical protein
METIRETSRDDRARAVQEHFQLSGITLSVLHMRRITINGPPRHTSVFAQYAIRDGEVL